MYTLLERQIEKCLGSFEALPRELIPLIESISDAYDGFETDRQLMERSLDISSRELREVNEKLRQEIAERKQAEGRQAKLLTEVMKANQELTHFAYVISHDLKSPLRGISSLANWISQDHSEGLSPEGQECFKQILQRIQRMYHLIDGLLEYSQLKPVPEKIKRVSLQKLVEALLVSMKLPETFAVTIENPLPDVDGEEATLRQTFRHLLANAVRFMDKPEGRITIRCTELPEHWEFRIADNGPGIAAKHFERIFRIFQTLERWEVTEATGIGLPLVKKGVEMHGGDIRVESEVGEGATFIFSIAKSLEVSISGSIAEEMKTQSADAASH